MVGGVIMKNKTVHHQIMKASNQVYNKSARQHKINSNAVLWSDPQTQYLRFAELIKYLDLGGTDKTILDVGCGNGEFYKFLNFMGFRGQYTGYDINDLLLKQARQQFSHINVQHVDILSDKISKRFDYVVMSGLFNLNMGQTSAWVHEFINKIFLLCKEVTVFNAITTQVNHNSEKMFYLDPAETFSFCIRHLSPRVTLAHHHLPYNYTMAIYKETKWVSINK
jgi:SAM-dependent methyltransferase